MNVEKGLGFVSGDAFEILGTLSFQLSLDLPPLAPFPCSIRNGKRFLFRSVSTTNLIRSSSIRLSSLFRHPSAPFLKIRELYVFLLSSLIFPSSPISAIQPLKAAKNSAALFFPFRGQMVIGGAPSFCRRSKIDFVIRPCRVSQKPEQAFRDNDFKIVRQKKKKKKNKFKQSATKEREKTWYSRNDNRSTAIGLISSKIILVEANFRKDSLDL